MRRFWTVKELARYLQVPESWIYERTRRGGPEIIPHLKLGRYLRFEPESEEFRTWLDKHRQGALVGVSNQRRSQTPENTNSKFSVQRIYNGK